ncbi:MAG: N-formylglutamate deformylase [marine bacterium B5-7]|nr:MAG: N-formylglutamate deformylase [marine bacterium B5-7]
MEIYRLNRGRSPVILSMPHSGIELPPRLEARLSPQAAKLPDTDWHIPKLYDFAEELGCTVLKANYSRYVVDLNRPPDDAAMYPGQSGTGLCPETTFSGDPLYHPGEEPDDQETERRIRHYWQPYHDVLSSEIKRVYQNHGFAVVYDCHSIRSRVPRLFDGELPAMNFGTAKGESCAAYLQDRVVREIEASDYTYAINGRFVGGFITRHYGDPARNIHAMQMELAQSAYMREDESNSYDSAVAESLAGVLQRIVQILLHWTPGQTSLL